MAHTLYTEQQAEGLYYQMEDRMLKIADSLEEIHWHGGTFASVEEILDLKAAGESRGADVLAVRLEAILLDLRAAYEGSYISSAELSLGNLLCHNLMMMAFECWERVFHEFLPGDDEDEVLAEAETACRLMATVEGIAYDLERKAA